MGKHPILLPRILSAASASVVLGVVHSTCRLITLGQSWLDSCGMTVATEPNRPTLPRVYLQVVILSLYFRQNCVLSRI